VRIMKHEIRVKCDAHLKCLIVREAIILGKHSLTESGSKQIVGPIPCHPSLFDPTAHAQNCFSHKKIGPLFTHVSHPDSHKFRLVHRAPPQVDMLSVGSDLSPSHCAAIALPTVPRPPIPGETRMDRVLHRRPCRSAV
jgi:hypothetical protein